MAIILQTIGVALLLPGAQLFQILIARRTRLRLRLSLMVQASSFYALPGSISAAAVFGAADGVILFGLTLLSAVLIGLNQRLRNDGGAVGLGSTATSGPVRPTEAVED